MNALDIRPSPIAGKWYTGNPKMLAAQIDSFIQDAQLPEIQGTPVAIIAPHAGHQFSGAVAGYSFSALRGLAPDLVAVLSPFHNYAPHPILVTKHQAYGTPLGEIEVDQIALKELQSTLDIPIARIANDSEHSLEIELPFLQRVFHNRFMLLPLMLRTDDPDSLHKLGSALARVLKNKNGVIVASTDLSHFYDSKTAEQYDQEMLKRILSLDPDSVLDAEKTKKGFACGHAAVAAAMWAGIELGVTHAQILNYATSGDVTRDYSSVVGYGAVVTTKPI